jgi:hypothetical protein
MLFGGKADEFAVIKGKCADCGSEMVYITDDRTIAKTIMADMRDGVFSCEKCWASTAVTSFQDGDR